MLTAFNRKVRFQTIHSNIHSTMSRHTYILLLPFLFLFGCADSDRPSDMPKLYPCTVSVIQGGSPLEGAIVTFHSDSEQKYRPVAYTGTDGNAVMLTYGFPGVPTGKYKITVSKVVDDDFVYGADEDGMEIIVSSNTYRLVEETHSKVETTPHEIETTTKRGQITLDVGAPVRVRAGGSR